MQKRAVYSKPKRLRLCALHFHKFRISCLCTTLLPRNIFMHDLKTDWSLKLPTDGHEGSNLYCTFMVLGSSNRITFQEVYTKTFKCEYQLQLYPFDTQVLCLDPFVVFFVWYKSAKHRFVKGIPPKNRLVLVAKSLISWLFHFIFILHPWVGIWQILKNVWNFKKIPARTDFHVPTSTILKWHVVQEFFP